LFLVLKTVWLRLRASLAPVTPASLDEACLRFMHYVNVFLSVLPATVRSLRPSLLLLFFVSINNLSSFTVLGSFVSSVLGSASDGVSRCMA
jgi:hypothetical protein